MVKLHGECNFEFERSIFELSPPQDFGGAVVLHSRVLTISLIS